MPFKCPTCQNVCADMAVACPQCGHPFRPVAKPPKKKSSSGCLLFVLIMGALCVYLAVKGCEFLGDTWEDASREVEARRRADERKAQQQQDRGEQTEGPEKPLVTINGTVEVDRADWTITITNGDLFAWDETEVSIGRGADHGLTESAAVLDAIGSGFKAYLGRIGPGETKRYALHGFKRVALFDTAVFTRNDPVGMVVIRAKTPDGPGGNATDLSR